MGVVLHTVKIFFLLLTLLVDMVAVMSVKKWHYNKVVSYAWYLVLPFILQEVYLHIFHCPLESITKGRVGMGEKTLLKENAKHLGIARKKFLLTQHKPSSLLRKK